MMHTTYRSVGANHDLTERVKGMLSTIAVKLKVSLHIVLFATASQRT